MTQFHVISMLTAFNHVLLDSQCSLGANNINISRVFINFPWTIHHNNIQQPSCSFTWSSELGRWFSRRAKSPLVCVPNKRNQWANWTLRTLWDWNESWMNNHNNITLLFVCSQKNMPLIPFFFRRNVDWKPHPKSTIPTWFSVKVLFTTYMLGTILFRSSPKSCLVLSRCYFGMPWWWIWYVLGI